MGNVISPQVLRDRKKFIQFLLKILEERSIAYLNCDGEVVGDCICDTTLTPEEVRAMLGGITGVGDVTVTGDYEVGFEVSFSETITDISANLDSSDPANPILVITYNNEDSTQLPIQVPLGSLLDDTDTTYTFAETAGVITVTDSNSSIVGNFDICQIIADNCSHTIVLSSNNSVSVTYNATTNSYDLSVPPSPALVVTTDGSGLGVSQSGDLDHVVNIVLLSTDANNILTTGTDGGLQLTCETVSGCITLTSSDSTVRVVETTPGNWDVTTTHTIDTDTKLVGSFDSSTGEVCFDLVNAVTSVVITPSVFCFSVPQTGHSVVTGEDTSCLDITVVPTTVDGDITYTVSVNPIISIQPYNGLECTPTGLYVEKCPSGTGAVWFQDPTDSDTPKILVQNNSEAMGTYTITTANQVLTGVLNTGNNVILVPTDSGDAFLNATLVMNYGDGCIETTLIAPFNCCNLPPKIFDVLSCTMEDQPISFSSNSDDFDLDGDIVSYAVTTQGVGGTLVVDDALNGEFTFTPDSGFIGEVCSVVTVTDDKGLTDEANYCVKVVEPPVSVCVTYNQVEGSRNFQLIGSPVLSVEVPDGTYETTVQYSIDGGVTWVNPTSYQGGELWIPLNSGDAPFTFTYLDTGATITNIRNCARVIGETFTYCDEKVFPTPVVSFDGSVITLSSGEDIANECYVGQEYIVTIRAYGAGFVLQEAWTSTPYNPSTDAPDLSTLPTGLASILTVANNTSLNYDGSQALFESLEIDLEVANQYDCPDECTTTLTANTNDTTRFTISPRVLCSTCEAIGNVLEGSSIIIENPNDIITTPSHNGNVIYSVYQADGTLVVEFAAGSLYDPNSGHFPMNSGTSYPLMGGDYYSVVTTPTCVIVCEHFTVDVADICEGSVQMNYNGIASGSSQTYQLGINPSMAEIQYSFVTQTVPDQFIVTYEGTIIHDSGQISTGTTPLIGTIPFTFNNDDFVTVEIIPDPNQPPLTVTIYSLSVGCCIPTGGLDLPFRDIWVNTINDNDCFKQLLLGSPYFVSSSTSSGCMGTNIEDLGIGGCVQTPNNTSTFTPTRGWGLGSRFATVTGCFSNSLPTQVNASQVGADVILIFNDAANYNQAVSYINELVTLFNSFPPTDGNSIRVRASANFDVNCGDDGASVSNVEFPFNPSMFTYDSAGNSITITNNIVLPTSCHPQIYDTLNNYITLFESVGRTQNFRSFYGTNNIGGGISGGAKTITITWGITSTNHTTSNSVQDWNFFTPDDSDPLAYWELWRGDVGTGVLVQTSDDFIPVGTTTASCSIVKLVNSDDLITQEIDYNTATFDLTYYAGGQVESFTDGTELELRLEELTGQDWTYIPHYDVFIRNSGSGTLSNITVTNP